MNTRDLIIWGGLAFLAWQILKPQKPAADSGTAEGEQPPKNGTWVPKPGGGWEAIEEPTGDAQAGKQDYVELPQRPQDDFTDEALEAF